MFKKIMEKWNISWFELLLGFLLIVVTIFSSLATTAKDKPNNDNIQDLGVVTLSYESGQIIQKRVYNANDIHVDVGTGIHFLGFVSLPDGDNPNVIEWANYMSGINKDLIITSERSGLYYYLPYMDYIHNKPISTVIVKYNFINIVFMDDTVIQFSRASEEMQEMQLVYSDSSQDYEDGYSNGYYNGLRAGDQDGYDRGLDVGYNQGKNDGYSLGLVDNPNNNFGSLITTILLGVGSVLGIELLPNITIGAIIAVPIVFGIIAFVLGRKKE